MMETSLNRASFSAGREVTTESWMAASHLPAQQTSLQTGSASKQLFMYWLGLHKGAFIL